MTKIPNCPICYKPAQYNFSSRDLMFNHFLRYDYNQCDNCDFIFMHPLPSLDEISSFYPDEYEVYDKNSRLKKISEFRKSILKKYYGYSHLDTHKLFDLFCLIPCWFNKQHEVSYVKDGNLLDVGCGNGRYLDGMKKLGWKVKGVEFNASAVAVCRMSSLDVHQGDLFSAKFPDNSFDVINISHVIEHVPNPTALFSELSRILKKNGSLVIKTPNSKALGRALFNTNWYANDVPRHLYLFCENNLAILADTCGLKIHYFKTNSTPKIILNSIDYVTKNKKTPSKKVNWKRLIAKAYVLTANFKNQGDEIFTIFTKV